MNLRGSVDVPRAALIAFQEFLKRFERETISSDELITKIRWLDSLLEEEDDEGIPPKQRPTSSKVR